MSNKKINVNEFSFTLKEFLDKYKDDIQDEVIECAKSSTTAALREVKQLSPTDTGTYKSGWGKKTINKRKDGIYRIKIYNRSNYRLTHLLEFGHALLVGRNKKYVRNTTPQPHITLTELKYKKVFIEDLKSKIERGK